MFISLWQIWSTLKTTSKIRHLKKKLRTYYTLLYKLKLLKISLYKSRQEKVKYFNDNANVDWGHLNKKEN